MYVGKKRVINPGVYFGRMLTGRTVFDFENSAINGPIWIITFDQDHSDVKRRTIGNS